MADQERDAPVVADDADSSLDVPVEESLASLRSSILQHQQENGRTYHSMSAGKYHYPNDSTETERYDLQHQIWILTFDGMLQRSPGAEEAKRVLDMGTGTGIWAIDFADAHPSAEVIGVDLSPIQPPFVPPNCSFEIDDLEKEWTWTKPFDFIMCRSMNGSFADVPAVFEKVYSNLSPGGYFEIQGLAFPVGCDDDTLTDESATKRWHQALYDASVKFGRPLDSLGLQVSALEKAGFVDITSERYVWPFGGWTKDAKLKEIGRWHAVNMDMGLEAFSLALLTRIMGWAQADVLALCAEVRKEIRDPKLHGYWRIHVVYCRKPEAPPAA